MRTYMVKKERNILCAVKQKAALVTSCVGTAFYNTLLKERWKKRHKGREDKEEDVSSSWIRLREK
jgi:hypothetical protein